MANSHNPLKFLENFLFLLIIFTIYFLHNQDQKIINVSLIQLFVVQLCKSQITQRVFAIQHSVRRNGILRCLFKGGIIGHLFN